MKAPTPQPYFDTLDTYVPGKRQLANGGDGQRIIKLSSNENPRGPSPMALEAYQRAAAELHRYSEDGALSLREALAKLHGFTADRFICGAGSDDVIRMLCHAYGGPGRSVIYTQHGFAMYRIYASHYGAATLAAPETDLRVDVDKVLESVRDDTSLVFIANPNNPTGSYISREEIHRLRDGLREEVILVLDGAYAEYLTTDDYCDGRELVDSTNTVLLRTFSKAYGLPSLRLGWGYGPKPIIDTLYQIRSPFNICQSAIEAGIAALNDADHLARHVAENNAERARLSDAIAALGLTAHPSAANFVLVDFGNEQARIQADEHLQSRGIIVRAVANYDLPTCLRITIGTPEENDALIKALEEWAP